MNYRIKMSFSFLFLLLSGVGLSLSAAEKSYQKKRGTDKRGVSYTYIENDPFHARIYTLKNGLKVYLARIPLEEKISYKLMVKAGHADSPPNATGLAHYLEHMMFKGTDKIGALNYQKEKVLLDKIEALFEKRRNSKSEKEKDLLYKEIDRLSSQAARYASAGEYSKLISAIGGTGLNAMTSMDYTAYVVTIPSGELEKLLLLEKERFSRPVMRLFHTELEAVYEEFNRCQDNDFRYAYEQILAALFPRHPYSMIPLIGKAAHLKEPSIKEIYTFYKKYYVPGNMALALAGDLDYEKTMALLEKSLGMLPAAPIPQREFPPLPPAAQKDHQEISGPGPEALFLSFRIEKGKKNALLLELLDNLLSNGKAGLIDTELVRPQKIRSAGSFILPMVEGSLLLLTAQPGQGQTLAQCRKLLLDTLEKVKEGKFDPALLSGIIANYRKNFQLQRENPSSASELFLDSFLHNRSYLEDLSIVEQAVAVTPADIQDFAKKLTRCHTIYKKTGKRDNRVKIGKPAITPVELNADKVSSFGKGFLTLPAAPLSKVDEIDFKKDLVIKNTPDYKLFYSKRPSPSQDTLFTLTIRREMGSYHDPFLPIAAGLLPYLGTEKYSANAFQKLLYAKALSLSFHCGKEESSITLSGFAGDLPYALKLLAHFMKDAKADPLLYKKFAEKIILGRKDAKKSLGTTFRSANYYAAYGRDPQKNPFLYDSILTEKDLRNGNAANLLALAKDVLGFAKRGKRIISYAGPHTEKELQKLLHKELFSGNKGKTLTIPPKKVFTPLAVTTPKVYLIPFDSSQLYIGLRRRGALYDPSPRTAAVSLLFNTYFGSGNLDNIVFQEIREARALAYSTGAVYQLAEEKGKYNIFGAFIGTQADKFFDAVDTMRSLFTRLPRRDSTILQAKNNLTKELAAIRVRGDLYGVYHAAEKRGLLKDRKKDIIKELSGLAFEDLDRFFHREIKGKVFDIYVAGNIKTLDQKKLKKYGEVILLTPEQTFGY